MASGTQRGHNNRGRFYNVNQYYEHGKGALRPSTSRGCGGYADRHGLVKKVTFKANNRDGNQFRKSLGSKTDLICEQLDGKFSTRNGPPRNNNSQRSFPESRDNNLVGGHTNNISDSLTLKESASGWYIIIVLNVEDSEKVLTIIETYITPNVFYPYNTRYSNSKLTFLVDDFIIAKTLYDTNEKIIISNRNLHINVKPYCHTKLLKFTPVLSEVKEKMIEAMSTRYNPSTKSFDLSRFYACPLFIESQLFVPLNLPSVLMVALNIVAEHTKHDLYSLSLENNHIYLDEGLIWIRRLFPELKVLDLGGNKLADLKELKSLRGFSIEVLNLSRNPLSNTEDKEHYQRNIQELFPLLSKLDNEDLPPRYNTIVKSMLKMPINQGHCWPEGYNPEEPNPIMKFLTEYYKRYDNIKSRQMVANFYHEDATFSLSSSFFDLVNVSKKSISQYLPESRNLLKVKSKSEKNGLVHKTRESILKVLETLPKTQHDFGSFSVDVPVANAAMMQITVNGVFAEDLQKCDPNHMPVFRSFCRTFYVLLNGDVWLILSDMLLVAEVTDELLVESSKRFFDQIRSLIVPSKNNNTNSYSNSSNIFMKDFEEMCGMEPSTSFQQQPALPNYPPHSYQPTTTKCMYQVGMQTSYMQNQSTSFPQQNQSVQFSSNAQNLNHSFSKLILTPSEPRATFPVNPIYSLVNQLPTSAQSNFVGDANANSDKLTLIKNFSNESGMNEAWSKKCLVENDWDYSKAAVRFSELKDDIPEIAFRR